MVLLKKINIISSKMNNKEKDTYGKDTYITLWRKIVKRKWYSNTNATRIFIHLLLFANYEDKMWNGILIRRGQYLTSVNSLRKQTNLSIQNIKTVLQNLVKTKEIMCKSTSKYTIITLCNYEHYNEKENNDNTQMSTSNNQMSTPTMQMSTPSKKANKQTNNVTNEITTTCNYNNKQANTQMSTPNKLTNKLTNKQTGNATNEITTTCNHENKKLTNRLTSKLTTTKNIKYSLYSIKNTRYIYRECSDLLKKRILEFRQQKITDETLQKWDEEVRKMVEYDNRNVKDIKKLINECHDMKPGYNGFTWKNNVRSMSKLRKHWNDGKIFLGMTKKNIPGNNKKRQKKEYEYNRDDDLFSKK